MEAGSQLTYVDAIQHTPGEVNPSDWPTRPDIEWNKMTMNDIWQTGPAYLRSPRSDWQLTPRGSFVSTIPAEEKNKRFIEAGGFDINHFLAIHHLQAENCTELQPVLSILDKVLSIMENSDQWPFMRSTLVRKVRNYRARVNKVAVMSDITREDILHAERPAALKEQQDLPPVSGLHVCEEDLRVPLPGQELPDHHLPPDPEPQPAPGPTEHGELESNPELADKVVINAFVQFSDHASQVQHHSDYFCWECDFREKFMYDQR